MTREEFKGYINSFARLVMCKIEADVRTYEDSNSIKLHIVTDKELKFSLRDLMSQMLVQANNLDMKVTKDNRLKIVVEFFYEEYNQYSVASFF